MSIPRIIPSFPDINLVGGVNYTAKTIGAVNEVLFTTSPNPDNVLKYNASVQGVADDFSVALGFEENILGINNAGVLSLGIAHSPFTDKSLQLEGNCFWQISGNKFQLVVRGITGKTINWSGTVKIGKVSK